VLHLAGRPLRPPRVPFSTAADHRFVCSPRAQARDSSHAQRDIRRAGHQARRGGGVSAAKIKAWWKDQAYGMQKVADATILVTGHYHHLSVLTEGIRTHIQAPSLDGGSQWFTETAGVKSAPGLVTFTISGNGWDDLRVLPCLTA